MSDELQKIISNLNIPWTEVNQQVFNSFEADIEDHKLIAVQLAVTSTVLEAAWMIINKTSGKTLYEGRVAVSMFLALNNQDQQDEPIELAKREAEKKYVEQIYLDDVVRKELLGCE